MSYEVEFISTLFKYPGAGGWTFATVPEEHAPSVTLAWGRAPVVVLGRGALSLALRACPSPVPGEGSGVGIGGACEWCCEAASAVPVRLAQASRGWPWSDWQSAPVAAVSCAVDAGAAIATLPWPRPRNVLDVLVFRPV